MDVVREDLRRAVTRLPRRQRLALLLYYADGLTVDEIASLMRISASEAESLVLEALERVGVAAGPAPVG